jgi:flagellar hook-length control protein FliK
MSAPVLLTADPVTLPAAAGAAATDPASAGAFADVLGGALTAPSGPAPEGTSTGLILEGPASAVGVNAALPLTSTAVGSAVVASGPASPSGPANVAGAVASVGASTGDSAAGAQLTADSLSTDPQADAAPADPTPVGPAPGRPGRGRLTVADDANATDQPVDGIAGALLAASAAAPVAAGAAPAPASAPVLTSPGGAGLSVDGAAATGAAASAPSPTAAATAPAPAEAADNAAAARSDVGPISDRPASIKDVAAADPASAAAPASAPPAAAGLPATPLVPHSAPVAATTPTAANESAALGRPVAEAQPALGAALGRLRHKGDGTTELTVALHPVELGSVGVTATVRDGQLTVTVACADRAAHEAVTAALPTLRHDLAAAGFTGIDVALGEHGAQPDQRPAPTPSYTGEAEGSAEPGPARPSPSTRLPADRGLDRWL